MTNSAKGGFNRVAGADTLPVLSRKVIECQQLFMVFLQADGCLAYVLAARLKEHHSADRERDRYTSEKAPDAIVIPDPATLEVR